MTEKSTSDPLNNIENINQAQRDMCQAYGNGSIGIIVFGFMWLISAAISYHYSASYAVWTLLIGGMFIFPVSALVSKILGFSGAHKKGNPMGNLAMEGTIFMIMCLPIALGLSLQHKEWFFQGMLLIIGGRYLTFASIYGLRIYWILGAFLGTAAYLLFYLNVQSFGSLITGSLIEISFGLLMLYFFRRDNSSS